MLSHVSIRVSNMERSIRFYTNLLGLQITKRMQIAKTNAELVFLQDPQEKGAQLELTLYRDQKKFSQPNYEERLFDHLAFEGKDMNQTIQAMRDAAVTITDKPYRISPKGSLLAFIEDPDGTLIELIERSH